MGLASHVLPALQVLRGETQLVEALEQHLRIEDTHYHFFAKGSGQGGEPQFHLCSGRGSDFDPAILRFAFFCDVHPAQAFEAANNGHRHLHRELINVMQYAIYAKAYTALFATRLNVDIAGTLLKGVLKQPVDDIHNMRVIGIGCLIVTEGE